MRRGRSGEVRIDRTGGEKVVAFVPSPLPPTPALDLRRGIQPLLERALHALGRLDGVSTLLPNKALFLYAYVRKEAVLSSQIEGTQSSLSDLMLFEMEEEPGVPLDDVVEVSRYVAALDHGMSRLRGGFPLSSRLIREIHAELLRHGRGSDKMPGEFRTSQNWIGGTRPGNATFVPPPPDEVASCMGELEKFMHADDDALPALIRAALVHAQFETIHPFLDGNGRVGRLLITFLLCHHGLLREPLLYLSLYFKQHRQAYYDHLQQVRHEGDWESWVRFFLEGVRTVADGATRTAERLEHMFSTDRARLASLGRRAGSALRVHEALQARPIQSITAISNTTGLSFPTVGTALKLLEEMGLVREITGNARNRLFSYSQYLAILSEGTEPER